MAEPQQQHHEEHLDVLTRTGEKTGISKPRGQVHRDGDYHRAVHVWIYSESTAELLVKRRASCKDPLSGKWDISSAGHVSAGESSLTSERRELEEELGIRLPNDAFELLFVFLQEQNKCKSVLPILSRGFWGNATDKSGYWPVEGKCSNHGRFVARRGYTSNSRYHGTRFRQPVHGLYGAR